MPAEIPERYRADLSHETDLSQKILGAIREAKNKGDGALVKRLEGYLVSQNLPSKENGEVWGLIMRQESSVHID